MQKIAKLFLLTDLLRVMRQLRPALRWKIYGLFLLMFLVAIFEVLSILSMTFTAMSVASPQTLLADPYMQKFFRLFPRIAAKCQDPRWFTLLASSGVVILTLIKNGLTALLSWKQSAIGEQVSQDVGNEIISNYLHNSYLWHISGDSNQTVMALNARGALSQLLMQILTVYTYAGTFISLIFILVSATPLMIIGILFLTGLVCLVIYQSMKKSLDRCGDISVKSSSQQSRTITDAVQGIREVLIYGQQPVFMQKFQAACALGTRARAFLHMAPPIPAWILEIYGFAAIPFTTWILIHFYNADMALITGVVTMVMLCSWRVLPLLNRSLSSLVIVRSCQPMAMLCLNRLEKIRQEAKRDRIAPNPDFQFSHELELKDLSFRYPGASQPALHDINCVIPKGMQVGLVGTSGSGKSTLAGVISGLLEPESGAMLIDGNRPDDSDLAAYRLRIGYVPQNPYLLAGSIADNVAFSQWGRPYDEERVRQACAMAALDLVEKDPRGIEYPLGEKGAGLSGGQAQRVVIARALYPNPEILILDESTSALDQQTENAIMQTINTLKDRLTIIIIAHRLSTVEQCDWLIWMEDGRIRKQGKTEEILPEYQMRLAKIN